jgi:hypothetical protein
VRRHTITPIATCGDPVTSGAPMLCYAQADTRDPAMPKGLVFLLIMIVLIVVYTIAKIISYNRLSKQQWDEVDKSKLREWDDDDPWD